MPRLLPVTSARLPLSFKSCHNTLGVHPDPDHLERDMAANRFGLLSAINNAKTSFPDFLEEFVPSN